jgi:hypothetical protein
MPPLSPAAAAAAIAHIFFLSFSLSYAIAFDSYATAYYGHCQIITFHAIIIAQPRRAPCRERAAALRASALRLVAQPFSFRLISVFIYAPLPRSIILRFSCLIIRCHIQSCQPADFLLPLPPLPFRPLDYAIFAISAYALMPTLLPLITLSAQISSDADFRRFH